MTEPMPETTAPIALPVPAVAPPRQRAGNGPVLLIALLALILAGYVAWREYAQSGRDSVVNADAQHLGTQVEALAHAVEQVRGNVDTLRARMDDGAKVDKSEREELLGVTERTRLLEDAVANLADTRSISPAEPSPPNSRFTDSSCRLGLWPTTITVCASCVPTSSSSATSSGAAL